MEVEQGTFTPSIFSSTGGIGAECKLYHKRLVELLAIKKGESYVTTMQSVRAKVSFALIRSALLCLRGSRSIRRTIETTLTSLSKTPQPVLLNFYRLSFILLCFLDCSHALLVFL